MKKTATERLIELRRRQCKGIAQARLNNPKPLRFADMARAMGKAFRADEPLSSPGERTAPTTGTPGFPSNARGPGRTSSGLNP